MSDNARWMLIASLVFIASVFILIWAVSFAIRSAHRSIERQKRKSMPRPKTVRGVKVPEGYRGSQKLDYVPPVDRTDNISED